MTSNPRIREEDDKYIPIFPHEARMRNMTYSSEIFADIKFSKKELDNFYEIDMLTG